MLDNIDHSDTTVIDLNARNKRRVAKSFDKASICYDQAAIVQKKIVQTALRKAKRIFTSKNSSLLDLGCATASYIDDLMPGNGRYVGLDVSHKMLLQAGNKKVRPHTCFINADAEYLPFQSSTFDYVFSSMALQWCNSIERSLSEVYRVLKPGGKAMLALMVEGSLKELNDAWSALNIERRTNVFADSKEWIDASNRIGFQYNVDVINFTDTFDSSLSLLRSLKTIGASTHLNAREHKRISKRELSQLDRIMKRESEHDDVSVSYKILFLSLDSTSEE